MMRELARRLARLRGRLDRGAAARGGFTLVEIMIVMTILAVGVIPIAMVQHQARREVVAADRHTEAIALAQAQLERLKGLGFNQVANQNGVQGTFAWQAQVVDVSWGLQRIDVTVNWDTPKGAENLTVSDLVSLRGKWPGP